MTITYDEFHNNLNNAIKNKYFNIHAVYGPDESDMEGCYMAAVDLFKKGSTYKMFFSMDDHYKITIHHIERWHLG